MEGFNYTPPSQSINYSETVKDVGILISASVDTQCPTDDISLQFASVIYYSLIIFVAYLISSVALKMKKKN